MTCNNNFHVIYEDIAFFLQECKNNDWELDSDDIKHVLQSDFDYIRKQHHITKEAGGTLK